MSFGSLNICARMEYSVLEGLQFNLIINLKTFSLKQL